MITMYELIEKKKHGAELTEEEINWFVAGYVSGSIPDYQASAWLMAVCFSSLSDRETADLTMAMARSGEMQTPNIDGFCADKHSTGGVGDKTTLIAAPIAAACGIYVPKMSGRGLGHTGGTIDKLESIPGFNTALPYEKFISIVKKAGFAVAGQTGSLVPADKKLYALRNATATVDSIPLICSSIMSKKLATGAKGIVLDVKTGDGAFMKTLADSERLANAMVRVGQLAGKKCTAVITDMNKPLGRTVGNSLEVIEAIEALKGNAPADLAEVSLTLAAQMLSLAEKGSDEECMAMAEDAVFSGKALERLREMIALQGGNPNVIDDYSLFGSAERSKEIFAPSDGVISEISCERVGIVSLKLGAGRTTKDAEIDPSAGIVFDKTVGDKVKKGERIAVLYTSSRSNLEELAEEFASVVKIESGISEKRNFSGKNVIKIIKGY
ncbi:MAG: thymidine phosphorylase [Oscillospiraceae bacterium]|nr:thymidine phosphorylase [Oscillospiraceae bacterium]